MKMEPNSPAALSGDQAKALDLLQEIAADGLDADDQASLSGLADIVAGRTFTEEESRAHFDALKAELRQRRDG